MLSFNNKKMDKLKDNFIFRFLSKSLVKQLILAVIFMGLLFGIVITNVAPEKISIGIGDLAPKDIRATKDIVDEQATQELKNAAMDAVEPRHRVDPSIQVKMKNRIKVFFQLVRDVKANEDELINRKIFILEKDSDISLSEDLLRVAINMNEETLTMLESNIYDIINQIMPNGIKAEEIDYEKKYVNETFSRLNNLSDLEKDLGSSIINNTIQPNRFLDYEVTQQMKDEAAAEIKPIIIEENQIIVREGDKIDSKALSLIRKAGLLMEEDTIDYKLIIGTFLFVLILVAIIVAYLYIFNRDILSSSKVLILTIIVLATILISKTFNGIDGYLMPISAATMLISIIIDAKLAILINFILAIIIGVITGNDINTVLVMLIGGSVGAIGVINTHQRYNIFLTGLIVSCSNVLAIFSFGLIGNLEIQLILQESVYGILNGLFCAILTVGSLPLWESLFGIITPLKLLELSNPNQPLLKKLLLEAPGTYHHSIIVGNLSEAAAEAIKANPLVARVGAYYHDVGKLKRPYFFKENQLSGDNPHDKINPNLSTLIITNHVKDGVGFAKKYKLPLTIKDIIEQHHGETLVAYFYHKAINEEDNDHIKESNFRYEGPKPQSKEAAIIMIADSVEAAVRSMKDPTKGKIDGLVRKIIKDKLNDGQLDECDLTLRDLNTIANSFLNILMGIFHERIEYPKLDLNELKGAE
ncbi:MAG: HDIG domain-containing protein [Firmicutes bacterium]|nr:HDIG domain-containing protein [Bacillota bacterium]